MFKKKVIKKKANELDIDDIAERDGASLGKRDPLETANDGSDGETRHPEETNKGSKYVISAASDSRKEVADVSGDLKHRVGQQSLTAEYSKLKAEIEKQEDDQLKKKEEKSAHQKMREQNEKSAKFFAAVGPTRSFNTIKHTNTIDYNPSRCKDWYEAGYCVFGNSCIFAHDRSDYKFGWEQEIDWEKKQKRKMERRQRRLEAAEQGREDESESTEEQELGDNDVDWKYAHIDAQCLICQGQYTSPTLLECGHIFCEGCAQHQYAKSGKCFKCSKKLNGIFNNGRKTLEKAEAERKERKELKALRRKAPSEAPSYLRDIMVETSKFNGMPDTDEPVMVSEEELKKALERIKRQTDLLDSGV